MTWEQFLSAVFGIAVIALTRLVDQWLPDRAAATTEPMAGPPPSPFPSTTLPQAADLDIVADDDSGDEGVPREPPAT